MKRPRRTVSGTGVSRMTVWKSSDSRIVHGLLLLFLSLIAVSSASAQLTFPRLGISASAESYVDSLAVESGQEFTLYVCAFGFEPGEPLNQDVSVLQWAVHQVCCGAILEVLETRYNPDFTHEGTPYMGVASSSETCVSADAIVLATLTVVMNAPEPGDYLAAAGPFAPAWDCEGNNPLFMDMPLTVTIDGDPTPGERSSWGELKALYR